MIQSPQKSDLLVTRLECLADSTRLRLIRLLIQNELGVADLCRVTRLPQSTVSRHLKILSEHNWTRSRREGTANLYRIVPDDLDEGSRQLWNATVGQLAGSSIAEQDDLRLGELVSARNPDSRKFFAKTASQWSSLRRELYGETFGIHALLSLLPSDWTVADLGCGSGELSRELARHVAKVYAVDQSPEMLSAAKVHCAGLDHVQTIQSDLTSLPMDSECCEAALLVLVLGYINPVERVLSETARILKPGGRLVVVDLLRHDDEQFRSRLGQVWSGFEPGDLTGWLSNSGFSPERGYALPNADRPETLSLWLQSARRVGRPRNKTT
ncbi:MAG: metalloregulator ArsR/SmtB family transcription factor [Phycisphaeraceae bacterium]|nr:metalloregulator ArsR/SmtB family transcription factor [Phycisphaeraceae bacterium]